MPRKAKTEIIEIPGYTGIRVWYSKDEPAIIFWAPSKRELKKSLAKAVRILELAQVELET